MEDQSNKNLLFKPPILGVLATCLLLGCSSKPQTIISPDGSRTIVTSVEKSKADPTAYLCVVFEIRDKAGRVLHKVNTHASDTMQWSLNWISTNTVRLSSSDIGTYDWQLQPDGIWKKTLP